MERGNQTWMKHNSHLQAHIKLELTWSFFSDYLNQIVMIKGGNKQHQV